MTVAALFMNAMVVNVSAEESNIEEPTVEGCTADVWNITKDAAIFIEFNGACPVLVNPPDLYVTKGKRIFWQAVDASGTKIQAEYEIFFEPFKGMDLKAEVGDGGLVRSRPIDWNAANLGIEFKYTVVGKGCEHTPLDPRFRLR
jgi:hypothetical protein